MSELTAERLRELLHYSPETGAFYWRRSKGPRKAGTLAGNKANRHGYCRVHIDGTDYQAHRLAWLYVTGSLSIKDIDHVNGNRADNRFGNLREASRCENLQNQRRAHSDSKSGYLGVDKHASGLWRALIKAEGKHRHLGLFKTAEEAYQVYIAAKTQLHPFSPTNS